MAIVVAMLAAVMAACTGGGAPGGEPTATNETGEGSAPAADGSADPFSLEADMKIIEDELAKVETPEYFKNTPTFEYLFEIHRVGVAEEGSFGPRWFEKKFNVKVDYVGLSVENRNEQMNLMFATGTVPDLVTVNLQQMQEYARQGLLAEIPIELVKEHMPGYSAIVEEYDPTLFEVTEVDGKNMGISRFSVTGGIPRPAAIRADWLENVGIVKVPSTLEELEQAFLKFRNDDPDGNGKKDTYALSNPSDFAPHYWFQSIFGAFGVNPFLWTERDGELRFGLTTPEAKEALKLLNKWYEMEIISPEFITAPGRSSTGDDIPTLFSKGKLGYIDHVAYDDHQWDNDGHINFRWVSNHPEWAKFFEDYKDDPKKVYSTPLLTDFGEITPDLPKPVYLTMPPVVGPNGKSGYLRNGYSSDVLVFGKQLEDQPEKMEKLLKILEYLNQDEDAYIKMGWGPEGIQWYMKDGERIFNPEFTKHALYNNSQTKLGLHWSSTPMYFTSPDYIGAVGGPRSAQRFDLSADKVKNFPYYENALKVALPSESQYSELVDTRAKEYVIKAIAGDIDVDQTFDDMVSKWYADGGDVLTREANEWYASFK